MPISSKPKPADTADALSPPLRLLLEVLAGRAGASLPRLDTAGWCIFVAEAARHGVSALAHTGLVCCTGVPAEVSRALEAHCVKNRLRNMRLYAHLGALLERFKAEAIDVIVLKGAYLAQAVYGDPTLRAMSDADLLLCKPDLQRAAALLRAMGWRQGGALPEGGHQLPTFERDGVQVELHWSIEDDAAPFAVDHDGLWQRALPARIGGVAVLALSPEDLLLHLCLHSAYGHGWKQFDGGLRQLADIAAVVRHHAATLDWHRVGQRALDWRAERCVWLGLVTARDLLQAPVPDAVLDRIGQPQERWAHLACELALGAHYAELARHLPALARPWVDKHWRRLSRLGRWHQCVVPRRASLKRVYPALEARAPLMLAAHWKDLAGDVLRIVFERRGRALLSRERERRALITWLEQ